MCSRSPDRVSILTILVHNTRIMPFECHAFFVFRFFDVSLPASALLTDKDDPEADKDSHQCKRGSSQFLFFLFFFVSFSTDKVTFIFL